MKRLAVLMAGAAVLAACSNNPPPAPVEPAVAAVDPSSPLAARTYMAMAASGDQFEIQSSQLALQMSQNPAIRSFAQMLIADHTRMSATMAQTASANGLAPPPPTLLPHHQQMLDQLRAAGPGGFDMAFHHAQIAAHQEALTLHQNYASGGDHTALRGVAATAVPVIQQHLTHVQSMQVAPPAPPPAPQPMPNPGERG
jgi:putative membrane protein